MSGLRIVATAEVPPVARRAFAPIGEIAVGAGDAGTELLIVRGGAVDAEHLERLTRLKAIARTGAGFDNLDVTAATALGIPIVYAPGVGSQPIAEGAVALLLAAAKRLGELGATVRGGRWDARYDAVPLDIEGACLGVIGLGSIGRRVARLCAGLGMEVIAYDPGVEPFGGAPDAELVELQDLLERADAITLHCELTDETRGLVDRRFLARVKPGAILVNVARGAIVESEDALADALATGQLSAVALDVFPDEPPGPHRLYEDPRTTCTPHAVGLSERWNEQVFHSLARDVAALLAGEPPTNLLNPEALTGVPQRSG